MNIEARVMEPAFRNLLPTELMQALRGIWEHDNRMVVVEVDQERQVLIASTYEGEPLDPRPVIQKGVQVKAFEAHKNGGSHA